MNGPCVGHIGHEGDESTDAHIVGADGTLPAAASNWVRKRFPGLAPEIADSLALAFESGFNAGGNRTVAILVKELRAQGLTDIADLVTKAWMDAENIGGGIFTGYIVSDPETGTITAFEVDKAPREDDPHRRRIWIMPNELGGLTAMFPEDY